MTEQKMILLEDLTFRAFGNDAAAEEEAKQYGWTPYDALDTEERELGLYKPVRYEDDCDDDAELERWLEEMQEVDRLCNQEERFDEKQTLDRVFSARLQHYLNSGYVINTASVCTLYPEVLVPGESTVRLYNYRTEEVVDLLLDANKDELTEYVYDLYGSIPEVYEMPAVQPAARRRL